VPKKGSLKKSLAMQTELKAVLENVMKSLGVIIELHSAFQQAAGDETYTECLEVIEESREIDSRSKSNFSLLLFSTAKVRKQQDLHSVSK
jgi:c-di-GMP-related signal transduction protein